MAERIGANVRRMRKEEGLSQFELAWRAGLDRTQVSQWENGVQVPRVLTVVKLAGALRRTPDDVLAGIEWTAAEFSYGGIVVSEDES
jgi:transcriptional regulator with XRE-family HTH domain